MASLMRTANPALNSKTFEGRVAIGAGEAMTLNGTVNKVGLLLLCVVATAAWTWGLARSGAPNAALPWMFGGVIGGLIVAIVTVFKKEWAPVTAPLYALLEGLALGGMSSFFDLLFPGIAIQAVGLTFGVLLCLLLAYRLGVVRATENFKLGVIAATGGIALLYLVDIGLGLFFRIRVPFIHESGPWGIAFSVFVVIIAALNLVLDFDFIESGVRAGAAKYMEWYAAFGLMVTLIWLYLEILRLLAKARRK